MKEIYTASYNKSCIGAGNQSNWRLSQAGIKGERKMWRENKSQVSLVCEPSFLSIHDCQSPWETNKNKQGRGWGSVPHPEVRTHSACQDPLSCCIFYEESPVAYYNIYRHLKIAKRVFLLHGSVIFFPWLALDGGFYSTFVQINHYFKLLGESIRYLTLFSQTLMEFFSKITKLSILIT